MPELVKQFAALWESDDSAPDVFAFLAHHADVESAEKLAILLCDQRRKKKRGTAIVAAPHQDINR